MQPLSKSYWDGAAEVLVNLGYPRVKMILPGLLEWIQDLNWPGAERIAAFLSEIGDPLIPHVKNVLRNHHDDEEWILWILEFIVDNWSTRQILQIQDELDQLSKGRRNDLKALKIGLEQGIYEQKAVLNMLQEKREHVDRELLELTAVISECECEAIEKGFIEVLFKPEKSKSYHELHKDKLTVCNWKSELTSYLNEIKDFADEVSSVD